ncbi:MAG: hypothetical protein AUK44_06905 [Porphyromonadaceae bacterium CG2_30_38_12]|nr:MAG: hypothetical protein AUK44_06905 [Porphyromonadaceae bacterium CG2_30_38_12]
MKNNSNYTLQKIGNRKPFTVPSNYFDEFALQMEKNIGNNKTVNKHFIRTWMYVAAAFMGVVLLSAIFYNANENKKLANAENYELYVMSQLNDVENVEYVDVSKE